MIERSHNYLTKIAIREVLLQNCAEQIFEIFPGIIIAKFDRRDV
jgi:hypothetical protein